MWTVSDDTLFAGFAAGDPDATGAFIERFQRRAYGLTYAVLGDVGLAAQVAREAFVHAARGASAYDARRGSVARWFLSLTRQLAVDALSTRPTNAVDVDAILDLDFILDEVNSDEHRLRFALLALGPEMRRTLIMAAFQGRSVREIAEIEQVHRGTVTSRLRAALMSLQQAMTVDDRDA